ncbi:type IV pilus biogenesis/stability protein PilW [Xanthomonadaceae bacterium JHOS43]|nr:type IV pilus biogenesis/stability protein PilW [Xanthomonadaceae bacterium JHOS43]
MRSLEITAILFFVTALMACDSNPSRKSVSGDAKEAAELQVKLGRGYMEQGELEVALQRLQRALQLDPRSVDAHTLMAVLHERINRPVQAESFYRKAERLAPDNGDVNNNLGAFLCGSGKHGEADAYFRKALDDPFYRSPVSALANAGVCALKAGDHVKADGYFRQVLAAQPDNVVALFELARLNYLHDDPMRARAFLQRLEANAPGDPVVLDLGQRIEALLGDTAAANRYASRLQNEFPDYTPDASLQGPTSR